MNAPGPDGDTACGVGGVGDGDTGPLDPWLANIFVNAPGSDGDATCGVGGVGDGDTGPEVIGAIPLPLENMRVNSPGADDGLALGGGGVGAGEPGAPIPCVAWNIFVNSPGPDFCAGAPGPAFANWDGGTATCGVGGVGEGETGVLASARGSFGPPIELNIFVNAPGADDPACPAPSGVANPLPAVDIPTVGSLGCFSIATGLKTRATSFVRPVPPAWLADGLEPAPPLAPGIVNACSMRVNSPGLREGSGCGGAATGCFTGSGATGAAACTGGG
ncbi:MAG TPA: hypothetical protein VGR47_19695 [Terracidiphilus sp.]|nr:hypothetical protein [Terracidiphilus sp.]